MEVNKPTFVIQHPSFLGIPFKIDEADDNRIKKYLKERICPTIRSFYVHGELELRLEFDICSFVSGEIKEIEEQEAIIFDINDNPHEAKIILVDYNKKLFGYLVAPEEDSKKIKNEMIRKLEKYKCI